jgi:hypothetical protein
LPSLGFAVALSGVYLHYEIASFAHLAATTLLVWR